MKIVTAIDSFKGSMTSMEAGLAVTEGVHRVDSDVDVQIRPLADGGEGTVEALVAGMNGMKQEIQVTGPLGTPVVCEYGIIESSKTAVIEMAGAAGITLVPDEKKSPLFAIPHLQIPRFLCCERPAPFPLSPSSEQKLPVPYRLAV